MRDPIVRTWGPEIESLRISPLSDIHIGSAQFDLEAFERFVADVAAEDHWYLVLNGDYTENALRSSVSDIWEQTISPSQQVREVAKRLEPVRDKILAITTGNHDVRTKKETSWDAAQILAGKLDLEDVYEPEGVLLILRFGRHDARGTRNGKPRPQVYTLYATHGATGGRLPGAKMIAVDRLGQLVEGVDLVLMGHVHDMMSRKIRKFSVDRNARTLQCREQGQVVAGSFLDYGGYAQAKGYMPGAIGMPHAILDGRRHRLEVTI